MMVPATHSLSPFLIVRALFARRLEKPKNKIYFSHARYALKSVADTLVTNGIRELLVPAYICREALEGIRGHSVRLRFFDIRPDMSPDFDNLSLVYAASAGLLLVHYFGFPNVIKKAQHFCKERNFVLIEDCAQALFSYQNGIPLGHFGDVGIFSARKFLPVPHGGYAIIRNREIREHFKHPKKGSPMMIANIARDLARWMLLKSRFNFSRFNLPSGLHPEEDLTNNGLSKAKPVMSEVAHGMLELLLRQNVIMERRQLNYTLLLEKLAGTPLKPLFPQLPCNVCPWTLPVIAKTQRDDLIIYLRQSGIGAQFWPALPEDVIGNKQFPQANRLREELLLLPVHQDISDQHILYMAACIEKWFLHGNKSS